MVEQPLLEHLGAALPVDVAAAARQEARHGVPPQVVDPAFLPELPHQGVDPGEAGPAEFPALEPFLREGGVDDVVTRDAVGGRVDFGGEVPGDEADVGVGVRLRERVADGGLGSKVHVPEEELADQIRGDRGGFLGVGGLLDGGEDAVVKKADGEGAEVVVRGKKGRGLRGDCGRCGGGLGEGSGIILVCDDGVESGEGAGFPATVRAGGWFQA